jgi:hypothetical protein
MIQATTYFKIKIKIKNQFHPLFGRIMREGTVRG